MQGIPYQGTEAAVHKLRQDLLPLHLAELPMQARSLHAACFELELGVLIVHGAIITAVSKLQQLSVRKHEVHWVLLAIPGRQLTRLPLFSSAPETAPSDAVGSS